MNKFNELKARYRNHVAGVAAAATVGLASAETTNTLSYSTLADAGKGEVVNAFAGGGPTIFLLAGMVGGMGWLLRKIFGI